MDRIKSLNSIVEVVRAQISSRTHSSKRRSSSASTASGTARTQKLSQQDLRRSIAEKISALDPNNQRELDRSKQIFLESVVLWEFGGDLINDPTFPELIDKIKSTLDQNQDAAQHFENMIRNLKK